MDDVDKSQTWIRNELYCQTFFCWFSVFLPKKETQLNTAITGDWILPAIIRNLLSNIAHFLPLSTSWFS